MNNVVTGYGGTFRASVVDVADPMQQSRLQVVVPVYGDSVPVWAQPSLPNDSTALPAIGDLVWSFVRAWRPTTPCGSPIRVLTRVYLQPQGMSTKYRGVVVNNEDPRQERRLEVTVPTCIRGRHGHSVRRRFAATNHPRWKRRCGSSTSMAPRLPSLGGSGLGDVVLDQDMQRVVEQQRLGYVASVCADGTPNLSPKGTLAVWDDHHLVFAHLHSPQTVGNIEPGRAVVEINVVDPDPAQGLPVQGPGGSASGWPDVRSRGSLLPEPQRSRSERSRRSCSWPSSTLLP